MAFVYSCCFWFSLRLGGILIALFSLVQSVIILIVTGIAHAHSQRIKETLTNWISSIKLGYAKIYVEYLGDDPEKYMTILIISTSFYVILCLLFIYGAYMCNNSLMLGYIAVEALRLLALSLLVITWLLILKLNTMDIGLLIWASVVGGFALLGMFYLWVCAANLPILINEIEREEQEETINKLRRQLDEKRVRGFNYDVDDLPRFQTNAGVNVFTVPEKRFEKNFHNKQANRAPIIPTLRAFSYVNDGNNDRLGTDRHYIGG